MRRKGYKGEALAEAFLKQKCYRILHKNYTMQGGEIDLIAEKDGILVFVEVKTFWADSFGPPEDAVSNSKKRFLLRAIYHYLSQNKNKYTDWRCDLVSIKFIAPFRAKIKHIHNIFLQ
jgi:putative endonuclease